MIENRRRSAPWLALAVLALGLFMTLLDLTIVNVAIPSIVDDLHASLDQILWVLNGYSLMYAVLLITSGRLGDIFGPRNMFMAGVVVFTVASALSGLAQDPTQLILARGAQGLGAAILAPQGLPIMTTIFPPDRRGGVFAIYGGLAGLAVLAGPIVGGFIVTNFGWRWIFYVNLPVGVLVVALALALVPDLRPGRRHRLDLAGVALATTGLFGIVFGLIEGQRYNWGTVFTGITIPEIIGAGVAVLALFFIIQWRRQDHEPLLPFAVFKDRNYTVMTLVLMAMGFAMVGVFLPITIYFQSVLGLSAFDAGIATAPMPLTMMVFSGVVAPLAARFGKYILMVGLTLFAVGMAYIAWRVQVDSNRWTFVPGLVLGGLGLAGVWTPVYSLATRDLQPRLAGVASGVLSTVQELGTVIGSAAIGAVLQNRLATGLNEHAVGYASQLPDPFRARFVEGFSQAASRGLEVGRGQTGSSLELPAGVPAQIAQQLQRLAHAVFTQSFVDAMRPSMALAVAVVLVAAACSCRASSPGGGGGTGIPGSGARRLSLEGAAGRRPEPVTGLQPIQRLRCFLSPVQRPDGTADPSHQALPLPRHDRHRADDGRPLSDGSDHDRDVADVDHDRHRPGRSRARRHHAAVHQCRAKCPPDALPGRWDQPVPVLAQRRRHGRRGGARHHPGAAAAGRDQHQIARVNLPRAFKNVLGSSASNPNALFDPAKIAAAKAKLPPQLAPLFDQAMHAVRQAHALTLHDLFLIAMALSAIALIATLFMPDVPLRSRKPQRQAAIGDVGATEESDREAAVG